VEVIVGDGSRGHPDEAPYDAIAVHAATPEAPHSLLAELAPDGRLVVPIATGSADLLVAFIRENGDLRQETIGPCRFVPLIGAEGFNPPEQAQ
jgi:protein-L-isoaspartate(D-aspartate) O-methyltransferase